jgi:hypothetical protein
MAAQTTYVGSTSTNLVGSARPMPHPGNGVVTISGTIAGTSSTGDVSAAKGMGFKARRENTTGNYTIVLNQVPIDVLGVSLTVEAATGCYGATVVSVSGATVTVCVYYITTSAAAAVMGAATTKLHFSIKARFKAIDPF